MLDVLEAERIAKAHPLIVYDETLLHICLQHEFEQKLLGQCFSQIRAGIFHGLLE